LTHGSWVEIANNPSCTCSGKGDYHLLAGMLRVPALTILRQGKERVGASAPGKSPRSRPSTIVQMIPGHL